VVDEPTESPSLRDGLVWDGHEWTEGDLAWQGGTWVPTDEPRGEIVNNQTWLERRRPLDRAMLLCLLFAFLACLGAIVLQVISQEWGHEGGSLTTNGFSSGVWVCLVLAGALLCVFVSIAVARLAISARKTV
jgi:ABC-type Fe3+ transport system permease subunit